MERLCCSLAAPSWSSDSWPILPLLPQLQWGLEPPGVNRLKASPYKSHWKNSNSPQSLPSWAVHEAHPPEFSQPIRAALPTPLCQGSPRSWGCWPWTDSRWVGTRGASKHDQVFDWAASSQGCELRTGVFLILPMGSVSVALELHVLTTAHIWGYSFPPTVSPTPHTYFSSSSSQSFQGFSKSILPSNLFQDLSFFLSIFQLSAAAVVLSFWWETRLSKPFSSPFKFRPPHLQGTFKLGIKHCTWQRFPDPAQTIIKFLCLRTCWTQTLFSLAREANLLLQINIKQTGFFWL